GLHSAIRGHRRSLPPSDPVVESPRMARISGSVSDRGAYTSRAPFQSSIAQQRERPRSMQDRRSSYDYEGLLACGRGELFGPGNAQLPLPPMLMFDRITDINEDG